MATRYKKGSFTIVPNLDAIDGICPYAQVIYLWLCKHADENGICYPGAKRIAKKGGMSERVVPGKVKLLEEIGVLKKTKRTKEEGGNITNLYQIMVANGATVKTIEKVDEKPEVSKPFIFENYLTEMDNDKRKHIQLIAYFFKARKLKFDTQKEVQAAIMRHARYASKIVKTYKEDKVTEAFIRCEKQHGDVDWSLETVWKKLTN